MSAIVWFHFLPYLESSVCPCHHYSLLTCMYLCISVIGSCLLHIWIVMSLLASFVLSRIFEPVNLENFGICSCTWDLRLSFDFHCGLGEWFHLLTLTRPMSAWFCSILQLVLRLRVFCSRALHKGKLTTVLLHNLNQSPLSLLVDTVTWMPEFWVSSVSLRRASSRSPLVLVFPLWISALGSASDLLSLACQ